MDNQQRDREGRATGMEARLTTFRSEVFCFDLSDDPFAIARESHHFSRDRAAQVSSRTTAENTR